MYDRLLGHTSDRLDDIQSKLKEMDEKLDELKEQLQKLQKHRGYYMYVAMQPAPVVCGTEHVSNLKFQQQVSLTQDKMDERKKDRIKDKRYPICFAELSSATSVAQKRVKEDLNQGVFSLVWSGFGCGSDTSHNSNANDIRPLNADALLEVIKTLDTKPSK